VTAYLLKKEVEKTRLQVLFRPCLDLKFFGPKRKKFMELGTEN